MNTVTKMFCLTLSLCAATAYTGDKQVGEHKGSESPRSSLNAFSNFHSLMSENSVHSMAMPTEPRHFEIDEEAIKHVNEDDLTEPELEYLKATAVKQPFVITHVDQFATEPFVGKNFVPSPFVQKKSCLQKLARLCCCCTK